MYLNYTGWVKFIASSFVVCTLSYIEFRAHLQGFQKANIIFKSVIKINFCPWRTVMDTLFVQLNM